MSDRALLEALLALADDNADHPRRDAAARTLVALAPDIVGAHLRKVFAAGIEEDDVADATSFVLHQACFADAPFAGEHTGQAVRWIQMVELLERLEPPLAPEERGLLQRFLGNVSYPRSGKRQQGDGE